MKGKRAKLLDRPLIAVVLLIAVAIAGAIWLVTRCSIEGCYKPQYEDGLCLTHYMSNKLRATAEESDTDDSPNNIRDSNSSTPQGGESLEQQKALEKARSYLSWGAFSKEGLSDQLEYEGFDSAAVDYAIQHCSANWKEQAAKKAKDYAEGFSFSRSRLIEQLEYEGFTEEEAEYGATAAGY